MSKQAPAQRVRMCFGFSLIELLLALALFAVISLLCYRALSSLLQLEQALTQEDQQWQAVMVLFDTFEQDVRNAVPRSVRISSQHSQPAWLAISSLSQGNEAQLQFCRLLPPINTRLSIPPGSSFMHSVSGSGGIQRIGYRFSLGRIERLTWPVLDGMQQAGAKGLHRLPLLENVRHMQLRYLSAKPAAWHEHWPVAQLDEILPRAVELRVTLSSGQMVHRLVSLE